MAKRTPAPARPRRLRGLGPGWACPACRLLVVRRFGWACQGCGRSYPEVAGLPDLRLRSDRYLTLEAERAKAERLSRYEAGTDALGLARIYYAMTADVDPLRRTRYLAHLALAERRGAALAALLPQEGRILEVGCGSGGLLVAAAGRGREIVGTDIA
ncbi:MAG: hypothetical protein IRY99_19940, partial [Isosphaeraceae bacterium]|nr:hypothetical protein [Isosphaeraceae bacterium]